MFPVTIGGVVDTFEGPSPLIPNPPPCKGPQLDINHRPVVSSSPSPQHRGEDNRNSPLSSRTQLCSSSPRNVVCSDSLDGGLSCKSRDNRAPCPDIGNLTTVSQLSSCRCRKRRHRGRHRSRYPDNTMVIESLPDDLKLLSPSATTTANSSSILPTVVPCALSLHSTESSVVSKSAPCDTSRFMGMISDPVSGKAGTAPQTSRHSSASPDLTPSKAQHRSTCRSWYSQAIPFFSDILGGDDDVTKVQCILLTKTLSWRSVCMSFGCLPNIRCSGGSFPVFRITCS
jgi:hypothetical protein